MEGDARFRVRYRIRASDAAEAQARAEGIALEQTVEVPADVVPAGYVRDEIVGRIEALEPAGAGVFEAVISYSPDSAGEEVIQLFNVVFGNSSMQRGIRVVGLDPGPVIRARFGGARFGAAGLRRLTGRTEGGLIAAVIKPQGLGPGDLAAIAARCVAGGADIIKDDHGLTNQKMAPFAERLRAVADAVAGANARHGRQALYFVHVSGHSGDPVAEAFAAKEAGAGGVLLMPALLGFGLVRRLAADPDFGLPIMTHPSYTGSFVLSPDQGLSHAIMYGVFQRLAGSDISVFPNVGGRFGYTAEECRSIAEACRDPAGVGTPILPAPGGGMSVDRAADMAAMYGRDVVYLLGGSLLRHGPRIGEAVEAMRAALEAAEA